MTAAPAAWKLTTAADVSFGGERTILAGEASKGAEIAALCNGDRQAFNIILPAGQKDLGGGKKMTLDIRNDSGGAVTGTATTFRSDTADFTGIAFDAPDRLEEIVRLIAMADSSISIASTNIEWGVTTTYYADVVLPMPELQAFAEACGFAALPARPSGARPVAWSISSALGSPVIRARGDIGPGMEVEFACDVTTRTVSLVFTRPTMTGGEMMIEPVNATMVVDDGLLHASPASVDSAPDGSVSIYFGDSALVPDLLLDLAAARGKVALELSYPATGTHEAWETQGRVAADAARHLVEVCGLARSAPLYAAPDPRLAPMTPGTWRAEEQTLSDGSLTQSLTASTTSGHGRMIFLCDGHNDVSLIYAADDLGSMPVRERGQEISLHATMQGLAHPTRLVLMRVEDGSGIFMSPVSPSVDAILAALRESPPDLELLFIDLNTDSDIYQQRIATDNVAAEADRFISICHAE